MHEADQHAQIVHAYLLKSISTHIYLFKAATSSAKSSYGHHPCHP